MGSLDSPAMAPHALCFPFPVLGHINPMMQLARSLSSACGFKITFLLTEHRLEQMTHESTSSGSHDDDSFSFLGLPDGLSPDDRLGPHAPVKLFMAVARMAASGVVERALAELQKQSRPVSFIISDTFVSWTQGVAEKFGIPRVAFWTSCASSYLIHAYTPSLISEGYLPLKDNSRNSSQDLITGIPGIPSLPVDYLPSVLQVKDLSDMPFNSFLRLFESDQKCSWLIVNSYDDLEPKPIQTLKQSLSVLSVGPLLPRGLLTVDASVKNDDVVQLWKEDESCLDWLDSQAVSSVIYVSFGSIASLRGNEIHELALGLESSGHPFLWVIRSNAGCEVSDLLPKRYLERTKAQGLIISWAPQLKVLSHSSVGGFLTHCGWNSTIESISLGVPLIGMPTDFGEQKTISWFIEHMWGVGLQLKVDENGSVNKENVENAVRTLMVGVQSKLYRSNVTQLREVAIRATGEGGSSHENLHTFAADMKRKISTSQKLSPTNEC